MIKNETLLIVIPVYNEASSLIELYEEIKVNVASFSIWEILSTRNFKINRNHYHSALRNSGSHKIGIFGMSATSDAEREREFRKSRCVRIFLLDTF